MAAALTAWCLIRRGQDFTMNQNAGGRTPEAVGWWDQLAVPLREPRKLARRPGWMARTIRHHSRLGACRLQ